MIANVTRNGPTECPIQSELPTGRAHLLCRVDPADQVTVGNVADEQEQRIGGLVEVAVSQVMARQRTAVNVLGLGTGPDRERGERGGSCGKRNASMSHDSVAEFFGPQYLGRRYLRTHEMIAIGLAANRRTLNNLVRAGELPPPIRLGRCLLFPVTELAERSSA
jgi:hypothetical protein